MKTILALSIAGTALFAAVSAANAQDCVGGYRMVKDQVPIACGEGLTGPQPQSAMVAPEEPLYTGSINDTSGAISGGQIPTEEQSGMVFAASRDDCKPGQYYMQDMQSMDRPARCP